MLRGVGSSPAHNYRILLSGEPHYLLCESLILALPQLMLGRSCLASSLSLLEPVQHNSKLIFALHAAEALTFLIRRFSRVKGTPDPTLVRAFRAAATCSELPLDNQVLLGWNSTAPHRILEINMLQTITVSSQHDAQQNHSRSGRVVPSVEQQRCREHRKLIGYMAYLKERTHQH